MYSLVSLVLIHLIFYRFYRVSSWKGIIELGVDENINIITPEVSRSRLELWKKFILLIKDFNDNDYN